MSTRDKKRTLNNKNKRILKQHTVIPRGQMKMPEKNIPVRISERLVVYTDCPSKVESVKLKYAGR